MIDAYNIWLFGMNAIWLVAITLILIAGLILRIVMWATNAPSRRLHAERRTATIARATARANREERP